MFTCENCKKPVYNYQNLLETRDGRLICLLCQISLNMCEICGSTIMPGQSKDDQLHYEEECFK